MLFVDVGGGAGHKCMELKARYPALPGKVILQDRPETLAHAIPTVESMVHDFFTEQPIKGKFAHPIDNRLSEPDRVFA